MSVSNYLAKSENSCKYSYSKLKDVLYLVSEEHVKDIIIDNGEAYISGLTELPMRINGFNIQFNETTSLDERYKFEKKLTLSMHGYVNYKIFGGRYYAIIESEDGTFWMINVDFPSRITHTFNLSQNTNQTDFTFASLSNFPTLKLNAEFEAVSPVCLGLNVYGIDKLELIEKEKALLDTENRTVYSSEDFKLIEFLGKSCSFQEVYDGFNATDTITFNIAFDNYKPFWQWNLLEFLDNKYSAIITPRGNDNKYYSGFNVGLEPSYTIQTQSNAGQSDIITITLTEASSNGLTAAVDWSEDQQTETRWRFVKQVGETICYECIGFGKARYLVKQEVDYFGNPTGNYQVMQGYASQYPNFHIVATFSDEHIFDTNDCNSGETCTFDTNLPLTIDFDAVTCNTYTLKTSCDWKATNIPSGITVTPTSGAASSSYTLSVCNTLTPTQNLKESVFNIVCCNSVRTINVRTGLDITCIKPLTKTINCLGQAVEFTVKGNCQLNITSISPSLTYSQSNNTLTIQVPRNNTTSAITWSITATNCDCSLDPISFSIVQDKTYERWVDESGYICQSGNSYTVQRRYTGTTSGNINTYTTETRAGTLIQSGDTRCSGSSEFIWDGHYYCVDGDKYKAMEQTVNGVKNGVTQLGELVESASSWCNQEVTYKWVLTDRWQCGGSGSTPTSNKLQAEYSDSTTYSIDCNSSTTLSYNEVTAHTSPMTAMTSAVVGDCVTIINQSFYNCKSLTSITIPDTVTSIYSWSFYNCYSLTTIHIPSGITSISDYVYQYCDGLTGVTIPNGVTTIGEYAFAYCSGLTSINIPDSVTSIGDAAFDYCSGATTLEIGSGVTTIGYNAFMGCSNLSSITINATTPATLSSNVFTDTNNCPIYVPAQSVTSYQTAWSAYSGRIQAIP